MTSLLSLAVLPFAMIGAAQEAPASSSEMAVGDDCAFLTRAFGETYRGLREEEGKLENADTQKLLMYLSIQSNTLQLAEAAGCDVRPMVKIAREQLRRYDERSGKPMAEGGQPGQE